MQNTRPEITQMLSKLTEQHINPHEDTRIYWAKEVTFDYSHSAKRVDYMRFKPLNNSVSGIEKGDFYCFHQVHLVHVISLRRFGYPKI